MREREGTHGNRYRGKEQREREKLAGGEILGEEGKEDENGRIKRKNGGRKRKGEQDENRNGRAIRGCY